MFNVAQLAFLDQAELTIRLVVQEGLAVASIARDVVQITPPCNHNVR